MRRAAALVLASILAASPPAAAELSMGVRAALAAEASSLHLRALLELGLERTDHSLTFRLPARTAFGPEGCGRDLGGLELEARLPVVRGVFPLSMGFSLTMPAGGDVGDWLAGASLATATVLDPVLLAASLRARARLSPPSAPLESVLLELSFAEALNASIAWGASAFMGVALPPGCGLTFTCGGTLSVEWSLRRAKLEAGLSSGGPGISPERRSGGPALILGIEFILGREADAEEP